MRVHVAPYFEGNPYQDLLIDSLEGRDIEVSVDEDPRPFSLLFLGVLWNDADVLHLHWTHPYFLFGTVEWAYRIPGSRLVATLAAGWFVLQVKLIDHFVGQVVWTVHNKQNHEQHFERLDRAVNQEVAASTDVIQVWDEQTRQEVIEYFDADPQHVVEVPHGNYEPVYGDYELPEQERAREKLRQELSAYERIYLYFGLIREYKQVPKLIDAFVRLSGDDECLVVAGNPKSKSIERTVRDRANGVANVELDLRYVPENEVPTYFAACDFGVFPYRDIFSSGSILLCMTFGRGFIAPSSGCLPSVAPEGNILYDNLETGLRRATEYTDQEIRAVGEQNREVALSKHNWNEVADQFVSIYRCGLE